jgi:hypothetical protein
LRNGSTHHCSHSVCEGCSPDGRCEGEIKGDKKVERPPPSGKDDKKEREKEAKDKRKEREKEARKAMGKKRGRPRKIVKDERQIT